MAEVVVAFLSQRLQDQIAIRSGHREDYADMNPFKKALWGICLCIVLPMKVLDEDMLAGPSIIVLLVEPLFLYVPLINDDINCVSLDHGLKISALVFRALADLHYLFRIINRICDRNGLSKNFAMDVVCVLPIPHVLVLYFLPNMRGLWSLKMMKFLNFLLVLQYLARAFPIFELFKGGNERQISLKSEGNGIMIVMNLCAFLLVSHVFGAFWYLFSIQRQIDCWGYVDKAEHNIFSTSCHENDKNAAANVRRTNNFCPINPPDASLYDFGIFLYALQSGIQRSTNFPEKFIQCFSWGLRNLSSFASNLNGSTYGWENLFVVVICISGLVLFAYLLGHMQTYMQATSNSNRVKRVMKYKVEGIKGKSEEVHREICKYLQPMMYTKGDFIIREGEPIDMLFFVITGDVLVYATSNGGPNGSSGTVQFEKEKDDTYGKELITWAEEGSSKLSNLPTSPKTVKCHNTVEVFALQATDLKLIASKFPREFKMDKPLIVAVHSDIDVAN